jgi:putative hemolysin
MLHVCSIGCQKINIKNLLFDMDILHQGTASQGRTLCKSQVTSRVLRHTAAAMRMRNVLQGTVEQLR